MRFVNPIPFVRDINLSRSFYQQVIGLSVIRDYGDFVLFETGFAIHDGAKLETTVWGQACSSKQQYGRMNVLLYFEHDDVDAAFARISPHVVMIHPVQEQGWGQRVFRFYDPDGHLVEIGEPLSLTTEIG
jgi:catechol 2,3-dioxygenase-like lactoylglutathione lyase family enzyme